MNLPVGYDNPLTSALSRRARRERERWIPSVRRFVLEMPDRRDSVPPLPAERVGVRGTVHRPNARQNNWS